MSQLATTSISYGNLAFNDNDEPQPLCLGAGLVLMLASMKVYTVPSIQEESRIFMENEEWRGVQGDW